MKSHKLKEKKVEIVLSFDDYHPKNIALAELLIEKKLSATFFIETGTFEAKQQIKELHQLGFEIGSHTRTHPPDIKRLSLEEAKTEIEVSKTEIERITGKPCTVFAYPRGRYSEETLALVQAAGYKEARTTHAFNTETPTNPFISKPTIHIFSGRAEYKGRTWRQMADFHLDAVVRSGGYFHIWGHAKEIDRDGEWEAVRDFFTKLQNIIQSNECR